jgi:putative membrane protein
MKKTLVLLPAFVFMLVACNDASNETTETTNTSVSSNTARDGDNDNPNANVQTDEKGKTFLTKAANSGMAEVQLAQLAQQKATIVKSFAGQRNVSLPSTPSEEKQKMQRDMEKLSGKNFDKEYISMMVNGHKESIDLFEDTRASTTDVDIKNFADKTLPKLKTHLDSAQAIKKRYW